MLKRFSYRMVKDELGEEGIQEIYQPVGNVAKTPFERPIPQWGIE